MFFEIHQMQLMSGGAQTRWAKSPKKAVGLLLHFCLPIGTHAGLVAAPGLQVALWHQACTQQCSTKLASQMMLIGVADPAARACR